MSVTFLKTCHLLTCLLLIILVGHSAFSQCPTPNTFQLEHLGTGAAGITPATLNEPVFAHGTWAGHFVRVNVEDGETYNISMIGTEQRLIDQFGHPRNGFPEGPIPNISFARPEVDHDPMITLYDNTGSASGFMLSGNVVGFNLDASATETLPELEYTATYTGTLFVAVDLQPGTVAYNTGTGPPNVQIASAPADCGLLLQDSTSLVVTRISGPPTAITWDGSESTDWNTPDNWDGGTVPTASDDVVIPDVSGGSGNAPVIGSSGSFTVNGLTIDASASITLNNDDTGMTGTATEGASLTINGDLENNGSITINSSASLSIMGNRTGTGNTNWSRNLAPNRALSFIGIPTTGQNIQAFGFDYVFDYDNSGQAFSIPAATQAIVPGDGYFVGTNNANTFQLNSTGSLSSGNVNVTVTDESGAGGDGFNQIANPYASAISAFSFVNDETNGATITGNVYLWDDGGSNVGENRGGDYITINNMGAVSGVADLGDGVAGNNGMATFNGNILAGQGFFVEATSSGNVSFTPTMQVAGNNTDGNFFREDNENNQKRSIIRLALEGNQLYNDLILGLDSKGTIEGFDYGLDAKKFSGNANISFYSMQNENAFAIQTLPVDFDKLQIDLGMDLSEKGDYELVVKELVNLNNDIKAYLNDQLTGVNYDLSKTEKVKFETEAVSKNTRFSIIFEKNRVNAIEDELLDATNLSLISGNRNGLEIAYPGNSELIQIYELSGKTIYNKNSVFENGTAKISTSLKTNQIYILKAGKEAIKFILK